MRISNWLVIAACAAFTTSCREKSTKEISTDTTDSANVSSSTGEERKSDGSSVSVNVPTQTRTAFETRYPNATNVTWRRYEPVHTIEWDWAEWPVLDTSDYFVTYTIDGQQYWTWYDENNNWIGTINPVSDHSSLPAAVNKTIQTQYSGYTINSVDRENDKDGIAYEIELSKEGSQLRLLIDENGKVLKKKDLTNDTKTKVNPKDG